MRLDMRPRTTPQPSTDPLTRVNVRPILGGALIRSVLTCESPTTVTTIGRWGRVAGVLASPLELPAARPQLPIVVTVVGDSQVNTLLINAPPGIGRTFTLVNGSVEGCGVVLGLMSSRIGFRRNLSADCAGWPERWAASVRSAPTQIALVMIGAWEVFDLVEGGRSLAFGSPGWDAYVRAQLAKGIAVLRGAGVQVALAELPCYRPIDAGGLVALPERGDDARTRHVNALLEAAAAADPQHVFIVRPPPQFCTDPAIARNVYYRWDGVHYGRLGASLMFRALTPQLLAIPLP